MKKFLAGSVYALALFVNAEFAFSQTPLTAPGLKITIDTLTSDGLLQSARLEAFERNNYPKAIAYLKKGLKMSPDYADLRVFLGRIYTWTDEPDSARHQFNNVLAKDPSNADALNASFDLEYWNDNPGFALNFAETGLRYYPGSEEFTLKQVKALEQLSRLTEAQKVLNDYIGNNPESNAAIELLALLKEKASIPPAEKSAIGSDSLFTLARTAAFTNNNYPKAIALAKQSLEINEDNEVRIFLGRLYNWSDEPDSSRSEFLNVLNKNPQHQEALSAIYDLELWNDHPAAALQYAETGIKYYPESEDFIVKKAKALVALENLASAKKVIEEFLVTYPQSPVARAMNQNMRDDNPLNSISGSHNFVYFDERFDKPWYLSSLSYGRKFSFGSISLGLNHANRFNTNGFEADLESYISITDGLYSYLGGGYSRSDIYSNHRIGFSLYKSLPWSLEAEAGVRYLQFTDATFVFVVGAGKYIGNSFIGLRSYLTPSTDNKLSASLSLSARFYTGDDRYDSFGISAGTGTSPDDRARRIFIENDLQSVKAGLDYSVNIIRRTTLALGFSWVNEEYQTDVFGNQYSFSASLSHRF
ncbi:MAG TPA: YaiO family outer membrane beta-barrel protein [Sphingobacteriaceae bacterium]